ncbi:Glycosidase [Alicyclobacillus vulcanalis]|uniref:Glycosidase n=1 Tax=Alicyclobacillus vulcanalis TaxID=252246 RepID=A0A1N7LKF2_9BACL|nr:Glycosidase [Alicyclobacillus vulcanalis]
MRWKGAAGLATSVVMSAGLPFVAFGSGLATSGQRAVLAAETNATGATNASGAAQAGTSSDTYQGQVQIVSGNGFRAGEAAKVVLAVSGVTLDPSSWKITLSNAQNGVIDVTQDAALQGSSTIELNLPGGEAGVGAGTYTVTVESGGASVSTPAGQGLEVAPYTTASTVQWDGIYTSDDPTYVSDPDPAPGENVTISLRAYSGNLTKVVLNCWDTAQNKGFQIDMVPGKTFGPYQLWSATIPASQGGTIYYRFDLYDGTSFACLSGDGLHTSDDINNNFPLPVGSVSLSTLQANPGDSVTVSDPVGDFAGSQAQPNQTTVSFVNSSGDTVATVQGENPSWNSVQFTVPQSLPDGLYRVEIDTVAKDADGAVNVAFHRSAELIVGPLPAWMQAYDHDSYQAFYRSPFGAVPTGTPITLRLRAPRSVTSATLRLWGAAGKAGETDLPMQPLDAAPDEIASEAGVADASDYTWWTVTIPASDVSVPGTMWYQFKTVTDSGQVVYYDDNGAQLEGVGQVGLSPDGPSYQISVYEQGFQTPDWLKHAVIYEIMPDRFYNGDIATEENPNTQKGIYVNADGSESLGPIQFHQQWDSPPDDPNIPPSSDPKIEALRGNGQWNIDFFGGDLKGIEDKLDYLKSLGVNTLYLMPVFEAESNHKYDTADYFKIDPGFGTLQDWLNLVRAAHAKGFHILLDGVFEDTGSDSVYFNKFGNFHSEGAWQAYLKGDPSLSPYYSWYEWTGNSSNPYNGWFSIDTLPLTNTSNPAYQQFVYAGDDSVARYWLREGADGWRLDSADNSNFNPAWWSGFRRAVKSIDPDAAIVGEIWNNATNDNGVDWLTGSTFDSVMNYQFRNAVIDFFRGTYNDGNVQHHAVDAQGFNQELMRLYSEYPLPSFYAMMNLVDSQDTMRILTILENAPEPGSLSALQQDEYQPSPADEELGIERLKLVSDFQFAFPGDPTVFYGDEAGLTGYSDPLNRRTYPWDHQNLELLNHYRKLGAIRDANPVLQTGDFQPLYAQGMVYAFARTIRDGHDVFGKPADNATAIVALNNENQATTVTLPVSSWIPDGTEMLDELTDQWYTVQNGTLTVQLGPYQGAILVTPSSAPVAYLQEDGSQNELAWTPVQGATGYRVWRQNPDGHWVPDGPLLPSTVLSLPVERGATAQMFVVQAVTSPGDAGSAGMSASSGFSLPVDVPALRLSPPQVAGRVAGDHVVLSITPVVGATQYVVYEEQPDGSYEPVAEVPAGPNGQAQADSAGGSGAPHGVVRVQLSAPDPGTSLTFRVAAQNDDGQAVSDPLTVTLAGNRVMQTMSARKLP